MFGFIDKMRKGFMWQVVGVGIVFSTWKLKWERVGLTTLLMRMVFSFDSLFLGLDFSFDIVCSGMCLKFSSSIFQKI
jgi:hypothetical protein